MSYGTWPVGFRMLAKTDPSRKLAGDRPRPVPIAVWFPAVDPGPAPPMTYRDYLAASLFEYAGNASPTAAERRAAVDSLVGAAPFDKLAPDDVGLWLSTPMAARQDPTPAAGPFPLVLIGQGNGESVPDQAFVAEYLASHGYVVASVPSPMRLTGELKGLPEVAPRSEDQARDMAFALAALAASPGVAPGGVGLIGHSFGARPALLLAMGEKRVAAVVLWDGGLGGAPNKELSRSRLFHPEKETAPILVFYETASETPDFELLRSMSRSDRWLLNVSGIQHVHFSTFGAFLPLAPSLAGATHAVGATRPAYDAVCRATLSFLDAFLRPGKAPAGWSPPESAHWSAEKLPQR